MSSDGQTLAHLGDTRVDTCGVMSDLERVPTVLQTNELGLQATHAALTAARGGDAAGLTALFRAFQPRLLRYLRAREPRLADDLAADTWLAVAQRLASFEGDPTDFAAWLFTIARLRLADARRTAGRRRTDPVADVTDRGTVSAEHHALASMSAQEAIALITAVLTDDQAEVILLRTLGDLSVDQVAEMLGHDAGWVRVTQHRATKRLVERYSEKFL
ncbi:unannotated protein [freshwater metagenome]|uniref:Unannotated protein n=1 Tax=freshwater metagenome TaxID=449393 RepID=A0A6J7F1W1_9ZZZZ|nr:sigma-70 family RNA polymerase sigma factor [Actinomycetota bacterium]